MSALIPSRVVRCFILLLATALFACALPAQTSADYATVRLRFRAALNGGGDTNLTSDSVLAGKVSALNNSAQSDWNGLIKTAGRTQLWSDLAISPTASDTLTPNFTRLKTMATAYATPGAGLYRDAALRDDILSALEWLNAQHYRAGKASYGNWFPWHLAVPLNVVDIFACIHEGTTDLNRRSALYSAYAAAIDHYQNTAGRTFSWSGANLVWRAKIDIGLGAALESSARLALGRDRLSALAGVGNERNVFAYVTSGDGFYADGSFIQHNTHAYTGGYGLYLINELAVVLEAVAATPWTITDPGLANVFRWVDEAFDPLLYRGGIMTHSQGREISRSGSSEHGYGHVALGAIARIARFAPPADAARFRALVKQHVQADAFRNFISSAPLASAAIVKPILDATGVVARAPREGLFVFGGMDRVVAQRGSWAYAVSLSSKRISKYESINGENLRGWYLGDGAAYLYNGDLAQYSDAYWPTVDPYRLAGVTLDKRPRADAGTSSPNTIDPRTTKAWVGGSSVDGLYGAAGMDHEAAQSDLRGKLSWFFFDDEVVHLGAGLTTGTGNPHRVESIVMNRMIGHAGNNSGGASGVTFTANGATRAAASGATESLAGVSHAHLRAAFQTAYGNADVGYYFPTAANLQARRESRIGRWSDITTGGSNTAITRNYLTLWFDHGVSLAAPGASFAYTVLPGKTAAQTAAYSQNPDIEVLSNTASVQAVRDKNLGVLAANFWNASPAAPATVAGLTADRPSSVSMRQVEGRLLVGASDPTQELTSSAPLILELPAAATGLVSADAGVSVLALSPRVRLSINLAQTRGRTVAAELSLAPLVAAPDTASASPGTPVRINVLANDVSSAGTAAISVTGASFAPPEPVGAAPHGVAVLDAAVATGFPVGAPAFQSAPAAAAPAALSSLPGFMVLSGWRDAVRGFAPKGSVNTGVTNYQLRSDGGRSALRFRIESNTTSNPSAGGATTSSSLTASPGDALYVGAVGGAFGHVAISVGSYAVAAQDVAALGFRTTSVADGRPYAVRALGFVVTGVNSGRTFATEFYGVRGQLLATQTATASANEARLFFGFDAGGTPREWIASVVLRGNNSSANVGLDDVGHTPVTAVDTGGLVLVDGLPVYTAPADYEGPAYFGYTITDGVNTAESRVDIRVSIAPVAVTGVSASTFQDPNTPEKAIDGVVDPAVSRWSAFGDGVWIRLELAARRRIDALNLSVLEGDLRRAIFTVQTSDDGTSWRTVFDGVSSGSTTALERVELAPSWARYVRVVGRGYTRNDGQPGALWNSFGEIQVIPGANAAPLAPDYALVLRAGESLTLPLLADASDPDAGPAALAVTATTPPGFGQLQLSAGSVIYTPQAGYRGPDAFTYTVSDGERSAVGTVTLAIDASATADAFFALHFDSAQLEDPAITGDDADPDADGLANLVEYALGADPLSPEASAALAAEPVAGRLALVFTRNRFATDLTYEVEASADLVTWTPIARAVGAGPWQNLGGAHAIVETVLDAGSARVAVQDASSLGAGSRFLRVRVAR